MNEMRNGTRTEICGSKKTIYRGDYRIINKTNFRERVMLYRHY